jgi:hypothetical protein
MNLDAGATNLTAQSGSERLERQDEDRLETRERFISGIIDYQLGRDRNADVYEKRLTKAKPPAGFDYVPHCIYFYYVRIDGNGMVRADHYLYANGPLDRPEEWQPIPYEDAVDPEGIVKRLALNARPSTRAKDPPRLPSHSFADIVWTRRSYIVIFFDEANWAFHQRVGNKPSVAFNVDDGHKPNQSFFDAKDLVLEMPNRRTGRTDQRSAILFVNHMKDSDDGSELGEAGRKQEKYKFDMYLQVKYAEGGPAMTVIFDPGGTNLGPPETP